jgi:GntR family transcriptional repressor for pyruvate dehydrogenase complex
MKTFKKIERRRLSELVASEIEEAIIEGAYATGSQLPSEQQLADQFGVSRNVVREAFKVLQERGLIQIVNGSGAFICQPNADATSSALGRYLRLMGVKSPSALYEARRILEGANARLAAQRADEHDFRSLDDCITRMRDHAGSIEKWSEADLDFHMAIARATHNPLLSVLLEPLVDQLRDVIAEGYGVPGAVERGLEGHIRICRCIQSRDVEKAYEATMQHLQYSEEIILSIAHKTP